MSYQPSYLQGGGVLSTQCYWQGGGGVSCGILSTPCTPSDKKLGGGLGVPEQHSAYYPHSQECEVKLCTLGEFSKA